MQYFVPCGRGLEYLLADELLALGADKATAAQSGVNVEGEAESLLRCALWSRFGSRALWPLLEFDCASEDDLYAAVHAIDWREHLEPEGTLAVHATVSGPGFNHSRYAAQRVKDAIVDRLVSRGHVDSGGHAIEPSAGGGAFVRALHRHQITVTAVDVDPEATGLQIADLTFPGDWPAYARAIVHDGSAADIIVGNPPFGGPPDYLGLQHALAALPVARSAVALILPWSWLGTPLPRRLLAGRMPCEVWPIAKRPWPRSVRETGVWFWDRMTPRAGRSTVVGDELVWR
jgi:hypothetical protein